MYFVMRRYDDEEWVLHSTRPIQIDTSFLHNDRRGIVRCGNLGIVDVLVRRRRDE